MDVSLLGRLSCKLSMFLDFFPFVLSSNVLVCIGLYRLLMLRRPLAPLTYGPRVAAWMTGAAYASAFVCAAPLLYVWRLIAYPVNATSCVSQFGPY